MKRGSHGVNCSHALFSLYLQTTTITVNMGDVEGMLVLIDMQVMPFFSLVRKQDIPKAVLSRQLVGKISQLLH